MALQHCFVWVMSLPHCNAGPNAISLGWDWPKRRACGSIVLAALKNP
jgi:hypothetical protein